MKKHILMLMLAGTMAFTLTACGNKDAEETNTDQVEESTDETEKETEDTAEAADDGIPVVEDTVEDLGIDAFLTAGEYKGIQVSEDLIKPSDADVDSQVSSYLSSYPLVYTDEETTVESGDTVNLDYSGSIDGVAFDGGTAEGYDLVIGSGSFIDDFEEQLIGMHVGEESEVEATFPDDYPSEDVAGKDAVFAVKINSISRALTVPNDEWLKTYANGMTEEEYRTSIQESMEASNKQTQGWSAFCGTVEFIQFPQDMVDLLTEQMKTYYEYYASMYGMEYDAFIEAMGMTEADVVTEAKNGVRNWLVLEYVCAQEGVTEDSDIYQEYLQNALETNGVSSIEEVLESGVSEWEVDYTVKYNYVVELIANNLEVTAAESAE